MDKIWWFGVMVLIIAFVALLVEIWLAYRRPVINMDDRNHNYSAFDLNDGLGKIPVEDRTYACCDHCYSHSGLLTHDEKDRDMHTVPCNVPNFNGPGHCQDDGDYIR